MTKFSGFQTRAAAESIFGPLPDDSIVRKQIRCCTPGKLCVGSLDGETFHYADGTTDTGQITETYSVTLQNTKIAWVEETTD